MAGNSRAACQLVKGPTGRFASGTWTLAASAEVGRGRPAAGSPRPP